MKKNEFAKMLEEGHVILGLPEDYTCKECGWFPKRDGQVIAVNERKNQFLCPNCNTENEIPTAKDVEDKTTDEEEHSFLDVLKMTLDALKGDLSLQEMEDNLLKVKRFTEAHCDEPTEAEPNNGGKTSYYQLPADGSVRDFDDFAEWRGFNGNQFNIGKVFWTFNTGRHSGTDYVRDLNKIIHYANREIKRVNNE